MWQTLSICLISLAVGLYGCIPTESPDDQPDFLDIIVPTATTVTPAIDSTTALTVTTTTLPPTTTTSSTTTTTSTTSTTTTSTSTSTTTTTTTECPLGYTLYTDATSMETACYYVSPYDPVGHRLNWANARTECMTVGGDLAIIRTTTENDFVSGLANVGVPTTLPGPYVFTNMVWIGGSCVTECSYLYPNYKQNWMYIGGDTLDPVWTPWMVDDPGWPQPDQNPNSCLSMLTANSWFAPQPNSGIGKWHDLYCTEVGRYACKIFPWPPVG